MVAGPGEGLQGQAGARLGFRTSRTPLMTSTTLGSTPMAVGGAASPEPLCTEPWAQLLLPVDAQGRGRAGSRAVRSYSPGGMLTQAIPRLCRGLIR